MTFPTFLEKYHGYAGTEPPTYTVNNWFTIIFFYLSIIKAALHSRENLARTRETCEKRECGCDFRILLKFSCENMREHVLTRMFLITFFSLIPIHIVIICESNTQQTCRSCHFSVYCHRAREL